MKKKFLVFTAALMITLSATFAQDTKPVPDAVINELHQQFDNATDIQWQKTADYYKASFMVDGQPLRAFYDLAGTRIGLSRTINVEQLPMALIETVKQKSATYTVSDLFELLTDRGTEYYITFKGDKDTKTYKSTGEYWSRY